MMVFGFYASFRDTPSGADLGCVLRIGEPRDFSGAQLRTGVRSQRARAPE